MEKSVNFLQWKFEWIWREMNPASVRFTTWAVELSRLQLVALPKIFEKVNSNFNTLTKVSQKQQNLVK